MNLQMDASIDDFYMMPRMATFTMIFHDFPIHDGQPKTSNIRNDFPQDLTLPQLEEVPSEKRHSAKPSQKSYGNLQI